jgi:hypothetical protein
LHHRQRTRLIIDQYRSPAFGSSIIRIRHSIG